MNTTIGRYFFIFSSIAILSLNSFAFAQEPLTTVKARAKQGDALAQYELGWRFITINDDYGKAFFWMKKSAKQGIIQAQYEVGLMYLSGIGVPQDSEKALLWLKRAAKKGDADAQYGLGAIYAKGEGSPQDDEYAGIWSESDNQPEFDSIYENVRGVPHDDEEAFFWFEKAARQGLADAQYQLGIMYQNGVHPDKVKAYAWIILATQQDHKKALSAKKDLRKKMTSRDIDRAHKLSKELLE